MSDLLCYDDLQNKCTETYNIDIQQNKNIINSFILNH